MSCDSIKYPITSLSHEPETWGASRTKERAWNSSEEEPGVSKRTG